MSSVNGTERVQIEHDHGCVVATILCEKVADFDVPALESDFRVIGPAAGWRIAIDMSHVMLLGSSGLGFLLFLRKEAAAAKGSLVLFGFSDELLGILKVTKLTGMFTITKDRKSAVAMLAK